MEDVLAQGKWDNFVFGQAFETNLARKRVQLFFCISFPDCCVDQLFLGLQLLD
jgi:hypothetical protein